MRPTVLVLASLALATTHCTDSVDVTPHEVRASSSVRALPDGSYHVHGSFWPLVDESLPAGVPATSRAWLRVEGGPQLSLRFPHPVVIARGAELTVRVRPSGAGPIDVLELVDEAPPSADARAEFALDDAVAARVAAADAAHAEAQDDKHHVPPGGTPTPLPPISLLVIPYFCDPNPNAPPPGNVPTTAQIQAFAQGSVSSWMKQASFLHRTYSVVTAPFTNVCGSPLPYPPPLDRQTPEDAVLQQHGIQPNGFDRIVMITTGGNNGFQGIVEHIPGRRAVMENLENGLHLGTWVHELAHLEGMFHANGLRCSGPPSTYGVNSTCQGVERADPADAMGAAGQMTWAGQFNAASMHRLGWMDAATVHTMLGPGVVVIDAMTAPLAARPRAVRIPLASGTYYVEARAAVGIDAGLAGSSVLNGVLLHAVSPRIDPPNGNATIPSTQVLSPYLLDGQPMPNGPGGGSFDALPFNQDFITPEGAVIRAKQLSPTSVQVEFKVGDAPRLTQPRHVTASVNPFTGLATVSWQSPELTPGGPVDYDILHVDSGTVVGTTSATSYTSTVPVPDGLLALAVRARASGFATYGVGAPLLWSYPMPTVSTFAIVLPEGQSAQATLTLPYMPSGPVSRVAGPSPGGVISPSDYTCTTGLVPFTAATATSAFTATTDGLTGELDETFTFVLFENRCLPLLQLPGCVVPRRLVDVTIPAN